MASYRTRLLKYALLQLAGGLVVIFWLMPLYAMLIDGFKTNFEATVTSVFQPPTHFTLSAYMTVWDSMKKPLINSVIVVIPVTVLSGILGEMGAYFFYSLGERHPIVSNTGFSIISLATFIPVESTLLPLLLLEAHSGMLNTYWGVIFANLLFYIPTAALLMSIFLPSVPRYLIEAARIDDASQWTIFWKVVFPLALPGFLSTVIFVFIMSWNNFFLPLVLTTTPSMRMVPVEERFFTGGYGTIYNETYAAAVLASIVPLAVFIALGRYFIRGLAALGGGAKGV
ncbi:Arabinose ABC transporter, permease [Acidilobus saccharovorans 345-15]|uniref:Arabinose ABC transporter, permease n=2 Tax=Acidilobus TaxID=105850 RepID=D9Q250_ACIS3|nr:glucose ABC transporter permease GlcU [Acidilobus saccharovorans]ADL19388.1 Arabinose ABC transporter, permease [Acidilobus saccharovorans 345-15]